MTKSKTGTGLGPTGTTTPPTKEAKAKEPFYEIIQHPDDKLFYWCLWSGNGRAMAESATGYDTKKHCIQAIRLIAPNSNAAKLITQSHPSKDDEPATDADQDAYDEGLDDGDQGV